MKKGIGLSFDIGNWSNVIDKTGADWFYNWGRSEARKQEAGIAYVPMFAYNYSPSVHAEVASFAAMWPGSYWLVGNEANDIYQDGLSPKEAGELYSEATETILEADSTAKIYIGGVLNDTEFMADLLESFTPKSQIKGLHWHRYGWGGDAIDFSQFRAAVNAMVVTTRDIGKQWDWRAWLTEFGVIGTGTEDFGIGEVCQFISTSVGWLEGRAFLQRYAWFCWRKHQSQTFPVRQLCKPAYGAAYKAAG